MSHPRASINSANASRQADKFWTPERIAVLRAGAGRGLSGKEIARNLGGACSGVAVGAKAARLGIVINSKRRRRAECLRAKIASLQAELREIEGHSDFRVSRETMEARA